MEVKNKEKPTNLNWPKMITQIFKTDFCENYSQEKVKRKEQ